MFNWSSIFKHGELTLKDIISSVESNLLAAEKELAASDTLMLRAGILSPKSKETIEELDFYSFFAKEEY